MTASTRLTPAQLHLLQMFSFIKDEQQMDDLKAVLTTYYAQKVDELSEQLWKEKNLSDKDMDTLLSSHLRSKTKY
jgi:hypothetical protein